MPLAFHQGAMPAARAVHCATEQGKFWELHDSLLGDAASLTAADIDERARLDAHGEVMSVIKTVVGAASFDSFKAALDPLLAPAG